jgi:hypothetical protein
MSDELPTVYYPLSVLDSLMSEQEVAHACGPDAEHCSCVPHLRAEIERLRAQRILSNEDFARSFDMGLAAGERRERAAVVAWLREMAHTHQTRGCSNIGNAVEAYADDIANGWHRREEER